MSPIPRTLARPPTRQNATSAPITAAAAGVVEAGPPQHRGGVARTAAQAAAVRDALVDRDVGAALDEPQRLGDEVAVVGGHTVA